MIESAGDEIFMMGWDGEAPQPINLYVDSDFVGYTFDQQIPSGVTNLWTLIRSTDRCDSRFKKNNDVKKTVFEFWKISP